MRNFKSSESKLKPNLAVLFATNYNSKRDCVFNAKSLKDILSPRENYSIIHNNHKLIGWFQIKSPLSTQHSTFYTESNI